MQISNPVIKNISEAVVVFIVSMFIVSGSFLRGYFLGENYEKNKLIIVPVFAVILTLAYVLFKKKYLGGKH
jgi:hypothetical protein